MNMDKKPLYGDLQIPHFRIQQILSQRTSGAKPAKDSTVKYNNFISAFQSSKNTRQWKSALRDIQPVQEIKLITQFTFKFHEDDLLPAIATDFSKTFQADDLSNDTYFGNIETHKIFIYKIQQEIGRCKALVKQVQEIDDFADVLGIKITKLGSDLRTQNVSASKKPK
eukprot:EST43052.1 Hypothetical protein SS50377_17355 [Spironucleus salmonicida]